ncbi:MAG: GNAT family N-acetyltransferase [Candidatus Promineofilum sp.]|nr:GNAT family N-acetyltransferase [Promineifilum sp.]
MRLGTGARAWIITHGRRPVGYAVIDPVPGLPDVGDLTGGVVPMCRQNGLGTQLLRHVQDTAPAIGFNRLSHRVDSLDDDVAAFLLRRDFVVEHEECLLELPATSELPLTPVEPSCELLTFSWTRAVTEFCRLYDESFYGMPWSQPYTGGEVMALLDRPEDLLFAVVGGRPIGVAWHQLLPDGRGRIEPIGISRDYQGRGFGRRLLLAALRRLRDRGANVIEIGLWRDNATAMRLYSSVGFSETDHWYFLACDL